ncbi:hypothetical protein PN462_02645 [Spirulina sp. CS-785/01]|uniref:hypothetical protein n=1 Tax=Spirulina sp. CS-785/01 TaxID=3021716 RepID=UPI00232A92FB|nr:hypothetical protein [Spirulina sp. CS-785/01]MDB9311985.1 hypothetical protein [Spirulina sp. CS-785/01]
MATTSTTPDNETLNAQIDRILQSKQVSRQEYFQLVTLFLSDFAVTPEDRQNINRIFDELQVGKIRFT